MATCHEAAKTSCLAISLTEKFSPYARHRLEDLVLDVLCLPMSATWSRDKHPPNHPCPPPSPLPLRPRWATLPQLTMPAPQPIAKYPNPAKLSPCRDCKVRRLEYSELAMQDDRNVADIWRENVMEPRRGDLQLVSPLSIAPRGPMEARNKKKVRLTLPQLPRNGGDLSNLAIQHGHTVIFARTRHEAWERQFRLPAIGNGRIAAERYVIGCLARVMGDWHPAPLSYPR